MLKKLFIVLLVFLAIGGLVGGVAAIRLNQTYGWTASEAVSHETIATGESRLRIAVDTVRLSRELSTYLPAEGGLPGWVPFDLPTVLPKVLPREIAILGGADFRESVYQLTLFVNEQRGGPYLPAMLNTQTTILTARPEISWDEPGFVLRERGVLTAEGQLPLPDGLESLLLEHWPSEAPEDSLALMGGHLGEALIDNRGGEVIAVLGAFAPLWGSSLAALEANPNFKGVLDLLAQIDDLRLATDFKDRDTVLVQILLHARPEVRGQLEFMIPLALPMLATEVKRQYDLDVKTETKWVDGESAYKIDFTVTGVDAKLKTAFQDAFGVPAAAPTG